jgi:hypothetical protein
MITNPTKVLLVYFISGKLTDKMGDLTVSSSALLHLVEARDDAI